MRTDSEGRLVRHRSVWSKKSGGVLVAIAVVGLCAGIGVTVAAAARSGPARRHRAAVPAAARVDPTPALRRALVAGVTVTPKPGSTNVPLDAAVTVHARAGRIVAVSITASNGSSLAGGIVPARGDWQSLGALAPASTYQVTATVRGTSGVVARATSTFTTLTPAATVGATLWPDDGMTGGVAQPVVVHFDHPIDGSAAQAAALQHFRVITSPPVVGGWHWFSNRELHFRPRVFWPAGEKVTVLENLDGWDAGNGMWGQGSHFVHFTVGDAHVSVANLATDQMTVWNNGQVIGTFPMSGGRPKYPTMNGTHIVLDRESVVHMISSTNGIPVNSPDGYDELVYDDVHISDSGEYVHAAPWSVGSQGHTNVSHGCINLSPANAALFMSFSRIGDVVYVVGGPRPPELGDHGVMDWDTDWSAWTPVVPPRPAVKARPPASSAAKSHAHPARLR